MKTMKRAEECRRTNWLVWSEHRTAVAPRSWVVWREREPPFHQHPWHFVRCPSSSCVQPLYAPFLVSSSPCPRLAHAPPTWPGRVPGRSRYKIQNEGGTSKKRVVYWGRSNSTGFSHLKPSPNTSGCLHPWQLSGRG